MSNLSYNYVESGIVLNISSYADLKKINVTPKHFAIFGEAFQFILDELDESRQVPSRAILTAKYPELDQSTADAADVSFFSVSGNDDTATFAKSKMAEYGVVTKIFKDDNRPTTLKQRYRASGKTLLRVSHLRQQDISPRLARDYVKAVKESLSKVDLVIFSDFNYGCLSQSVVSEIIKACKSKNIKMVADSQSSSQIGDVSRFKGMVLLTPTEREARLAMRDFNSGLVVLAEKLRKKTQAQNIILTLGTEGLIAHAPSIERDDWLTDRLPAFNTAPKDIAGAGDSLLACSALALVAGANIWQSSYLGSIAAACQVSRVGNIPLSISDIELELRD